MIFWIFVFVVSLYVLIKSADIFTESAEHIGLKFGLSQMVIGVTIVAFGTSLPEILSSVFAVVKGNTPIVVGNVMGSNIANILLVLGIMAIVGKSVKISSKHMLNDVAFLIWSVTFFSIFIYTGVFTIIHGILSLILLAWYLFKTMSYKKIELVEKRNFEKKYYAFFPISILGLYFGAQYTVQGLIVSATSIGLNPAIASATFLALGTSLPELSVCLTALKKKKAELAIGNIIGSNIFNLYGVMGIASLFGSIYVSRFMIEVVFNHMLLATLLFMMYVQKKKITRGAGILFVGLYIAFLVNLLFFGM
ncbi:MAG: calcium/sodium antiporter [Candidatus Woesearchaeota archaeon]